jgi:E3 ubiquitin-protein ligase mind-bomb
VPKRAGSLKITSKGIFKGAICVRGPDWDWQDQDGGEGKSGKVLEIRGWDRESGNSVACVQWNGSGCSNVYRVGHKGKVDLKYIQEGVGGFYYKDHLAVFGLTLDEPIISISNLSLNGNSNSFSVGDKVKINVSVEVFKQTQEGHGGWNQKMTDLIGKVGSVHRVTEKGDIRVQYEGTDNRWTICPNALTKVCTFSVGDYVRISNEEDVVKTLQKGHGEWTDNMKTVRIFNNN